MAVINETLSLTDSFSQTFKSFNNLGERAISTMVSLDTNLTRVLNNNSQITNNNIQALSTQSSIVIGRLNEISAKLNNVNSDQKRVTNETKQTANAAGNWLNKIKSVAVAIGAVNLTKTFLQTADSMAQIDAKLSMINDSMQTNAELQEMIYQSAQRSRGSYDTTANLVARIGQNAKEAFGTNAEMVQFAENLNKQFIIGGASAEEQASATLQLTQALGSGVLRGQELNAVFAAAPNVIRNIADYLGVSVGEIRKMAEQGMLTADVVKNALLSATDEINENFSKMPMTLSQAFTMGKNAIRQSLKDAFSGWEAFLNTDEGQAAIEQVIGLMQTLAQVGVNALSLVGQAALWVSQNMDIIIAVLGGIAAAFIVVKGEAIAAAFATASAWITTNWPLLLLVAAVAAGIMAFKALGVTTGQVAGVVGTALGMIYAIGYNVFANLWNVIASFAEFLATVWDDPLGATARLFFDVFDAVLGIIESAAGALDALFDTNWSGAVSGFRDKVNGFVIDKIGESGVSVKRMEEIDVAATAKEWSAGAQNLVDSLDNFSLDFGGDSGLNFSGVGGLGTDASGKQNVGSVDKVKSIEGDVKLSDEDLKLYRDMAEQRYLNQIELKTLAPNISVTIPGGANGSLRAEDVANEIKRMLITQMSANTAVSH